jgi:4-hydroxybenzoate polyprenyltransferase
VLCCAVLCRAVLMRTYRPQRKKVHWLMHSLAAVCAVLGLLAAWKSHTLKVSTDTHILTTLSPLLQPHGPAAPI